MKILHLTLKKKWFDMIASGEKLEEYREIKYYWWKRLIKDSDWGTDSDYHIVFPAGLVKAKNFESFDLVKFTNGYGKNAPTFTIECKGIEISFPSQHNDWCEDLDKTTECFVIKLGNIVNP